MKKEEKTRITRAKIFEAAIKEFGTNGYAAGSLNNICKTGINKGLIYHNFKDKDELYLECVRKSCGDLKWYITENQAQDGFVEYMRARMSFFAEHESEANIFLEARTKPPHHLTDQIQTIYKEFDELNLMIYEKELSKHELRKGVSGEDALKFFSDIQRMYNLNFANESDGRSLKERLEQHELHIYKMFDLMLYGIAKDVEEKDSEKAGNTCDSPCREVNRSLQ